MTDVDSGSELKKCPVFSILPWMTGGGGTHPEKLPDEPVEAFMSFRLTSEINLCESSVVVGNFIISYVMISI